MLIHVDPWQDFMTMEAPFTQTCGSRVLPMAWGGSYWHHDIGDKEAGLSGGAHNPAVP